MKREIRIKFIKHTFPKSIVLSWFRFNHPKMPLEKLMTCKTEFRVKLSNHNIYPSTVKEVIKAIKETGMWGYCDKITRGLNNPIIHYWISKKDLTNKIKVLELFAHEMTHAFGYSSEKIALRSGAIAALSYQCMMEELYGNSAKNNKT